MRPDTSFRTNTGERGKTGKQQLRRNSQPRESWPRPELSCFSTRCYSWLDGKIVEPSGNEPKRRRGTCGSIIPWVFPFDARSHFSVKAAILETKASNAFLRPFRRFHSFVRSSRRRRDSIVTSILFLSVFLGSVFVSSRNSLKLYRVTRLLTPSSSDIFHSVSPDSVQVRTELMRRLFRVTSRRSLKKKRKKKKKEKEIDFSTCSVYV